ncbi:NADPH:quinone reductase (plasmid) [Phaeobacter inhibens]|uniref:zinc-binding alcohol dehydrogenase family protein n=1 Tax=Phaeobacter inhibens TaxID=221822 RepID=UPI000971B4DC|nr:zinc-binding alcohol dehydrogenase family protein [Phaeobacter inhibens]APX18005.1 NADPH:quinone reductase [Phaeobacter inhibens]
MEIPMRAIGFKTSHPITETDALIEFEMKDPTPGANDLLVRVKATSINPADAKIRRGSAKGTVREEPRILGYDAVGIVERIGGSVEGFKIGDRVWYAGDVTRPGANAELQAVDSRVAAHAPNSLSDVEAAVMPLTTLTGWEAIFDRLRIDPSEKKTILIIGGAGGVGSITTQIAKTTTNLTVIATASRPETESWAKKMGADHVANHRDLVNSVKALGFDTVDYIFNTADTAGHWDAMVELIAPQGMISLIVEFDGGVDLAKLQGKSAGFVWELMFTRTIHQTKDIDRQRDILTQMAKLVDEGRVQTTLTETLQGFDPKTLIEAHAKIESGRSIGKIGIAY